MIEPDDRKRPRFDQADVDLLWDVSRGIATFYNQGDRENAKTRDALRDLANRIERLLPLDL